MNASDPGRPEDDAAASLRRALRATAGELAPPPYPAERVRRLGRRRVRTRRALVAVPAAVAAVLAAAIALPQWPGGEGRPAADSAGGEALGPRATPSPAPAQPATPSARPWPSVRTVGAGEPVEIGRGQVLTLGADQVCHRDTTEPGGGVEDTCKSVSDGNQAVGSVSIQSSGALLRPLYIGPGRAARMTVEVDGEVLRAQVLTLEGNPGYAVGYAWGSGVSFDGPTPKVRVSDAEGGLLAEFP
ncbi:MULTISPECIES: hypothetical protein [Streptomyces]|uniref:Uncharacterized protein n=1 Tax=Streptomyces fungicidicus TaxID=68203 RepID=A0ACC7XV39_9ACTN|nr:MULTISPECIES: hypothetical protein [Streptomyces]MBF4132657.1 hypothetical protein [Streptomyces albidoflavus]NUV73427.1 hypothetical protein [Streptomyces fungicidicus]